MNRYIIADEAIQDLQDISDYFLKNNLARQTEIPTAYRNGMLWDERQAS
jgi:hypothetical protein